MRETIEFKVEDKSGGDTKAELIVDTEIDVFEFSMVNKTIMSGMWSENLQRVFQRALEIWKVDPEIEEV